MDVLPRMIRRLFDPTGAMSPFQRAILFAAPLIALAGLAWMVTANRPGDFRPVLYGRVLTGDELISVERALSQAGLRDYRRQGRKILAPAQTLDQYNAVLMMSDAGTADLGSQVLKSFESLGQSSSAQHRQDLKDAILLQELRRTIKAVPDIEDARVTVANPVRRIESGSRSRVTANVAVKLRPGRDLTGQLAASLRQAVASMVPDLLAADVTIFDIARGIAYSGDDADEPVVNRIVQRVREFTRQYEQQIQKALDFIPNVTVAVHVDLDHIKSSVIRKEQIRVTRDESLIANRPGSIHQAGFEDGDLTLRSSAFSTQDWPTNYSREVSERELQAAMPRAVQVSVSIPRDYYRAVAAWRKNKGETNSDRLDLDSIEQEVLTKVEQKVARLIPVGSMRDAISVTTVDRLPNDTAIPPLTLMDQFSVIAWRHGGSWGLGLFTLLALWMLARTGAAANRNRQSQSFSSSPEFRSAWAEPVHNAAPGRHHIDIPANPVAATDSSWNAQNPSNPQTAPDAKSKTDQITAPMQVEPAILADPTLQPATPVTSVLPSKEASLSNPAESGSATAISTSQNQNAALPATATSDAVIPFGTVPAAAPGSITNPPVADPFDFLNRLHPDDVYPVLQEEQPQTIAVIAAHLSPTQAAAILAEFAADRQAEILQRMTRLGPTDREILNDIAAELRTRLGRPRVRAGGVATAADLLRESARSTSRSMLKSLDDCDPDLADELRQTLFSFDDLLKLDDDTLRIVLQETDDRQWALALKASPAPVRQKVLNCLSPRVVKAFQDEMNSLGPVRLSDMTNVRQQIADSIRRLEDSGMIVLPRHQEPGSQIPHRH